MVRGSEETCYLMVRTSKDTVSMVRRCEETRYLIYSTFTAPEIHFDLNRGVYGVFFYWRLVRFLNAVKKGDPILKSRQL